MYGWMGRLLRVDLSRGTIVEEAIEQRDLEMFLGGRGLGAKIVYEEVGPDVDPLSPQNRLVFATGPVTATKVQTSSRFSVSTKAPLTGTIHDSNAGGRWGHRFKKAGYDALIVQGKAAEPVYLFVDENGAVLKEASELWGKNTKQVTEELSAIYGKDSNVLAIGPAGENFVLISSIVADGHRQLARSGVGAVMGSKNLKAIVVKGEREISVADQDRLDFVFYETSKMLKANPITSKGLPEFGTSMLVNLFNELGILPTRNFQQGSFEKAYQISGEAMADTILVKNTACHNCPIACTRKVKTAKVNGEGPEYETVWSLGADIGVGNIESIAEANWLCNELGIDTISAGGTLACAMEMSQNGIIEEKIEWGDADKVLKLIEDIAYRRGIGDELAEGSKRFAEKYGVPDYAIHVKGLEFPAYDPRGMQGQGLLFATSNRGACHLRGNMLGLEVLGVPKMVDRFATSGKAGLLIVTQHTSAALDSLVMCKFTGFAVGDDFFARLLSAVTGIDYEAQDIQIIGERIWNLERMYNLREGFTKADDTLPKRILEQPLESGGSAGHVVDLEPMLQEYYRFRGWSSEGVPTAKKLESLGLSELTGKPQATQSA